MNPKLVIEVAGILTDPTFQRMRHMALELREHFSSSVSIIVRSMVEADYEPYLMDRGLRQAFPHHDVRYPIAFAPSQSSSECDTYIGDTETFLDFCAQKYGLADTSMVSPCQYVDMASAAWDEYQTRSNNIFCFLKFTVDGQPLVPEADDRVVLELYHEACPKAAENFASLCDANPGYTGLPVHRIVEGGWIQSGDVQNSGRGDGKGGSVVNEGEETFEDEGFSISHDRAGILSMANCGPHTNGAQFFITLTSLPWLDKNKVAFGRVVSGMKTIEAIGKLKTVNERPVTPCIIAASGRL